MRGWAIKTNPAIPISMRSPRRWSNIAAIPPRQSVRSGFISPEPLSTSSPSHRPASFAACSSSVLRARRCSIRRRSKWLSKRLRFRRCRATIRATASSSSRPSRSIRKLNSALSWTRWGWGSPKPPARADDSYDPVVGVGRLDPPRGGFPLPPPRRLLLRGEAGERNRGQYLVPIGAVDRLGARILGAVDLGRRVGRADRDRRRRDRRQYGRPQSHRLGQLHRRLWRHFVDLSRRRRDRPRGRQEAFQIEHEHRPHGLLRALYRRIALCAVRARLAVAASADRRYRAVDDLGRG